MKRLMSILILSLFLVFIMGNAKAQNLEETLQSMLSNNAEKYVNPMVTAFGSTMNSGLYNKAKVHKMLGFDVGVKVMAAQISDGQRTFNFELSENEITIPLSEVNTLLSDVTLPFSDLYLGSDTEAATVFGDTEPGELTPNYDHIMQVIEDQSGLSTAEFDQVEAQVRNKVESTVEPFPLPPGFDVPAFPMVMPQVAVGLPLKTEVTARFVPTVDLGDYGEFNMLGLGARINVDQFIPIPLFPVDITAGAFFQSMSVGSFLSATNTSFHAEVGKTLSLLIFSVSAYAGFGIESTNVTMDYTVPESGTPGTPGYMPEIPVEFDMTGENTSRINAGLSITLIPLTYINVDYAIGTDNVLTLGLGLSLR